jgi:hypothetical protein
MDRIGCDRIWKLLDTGHKSFIDGITLGIMLSMKISYVMGNGDILYRLRLAVLTRETEKYDWIYRLTYTPCK